MNRPSQISWVLFKTAIFTALAPFMVGLYLPRIVHNAFTPVNDLQIGRIWQLVILSPGALLFGAVIYLWCAWDFASKGMGTPAPIDAPKKLVVNGLYRFVRNPMYLGVSCLIISQAMLWASIAILVYLVFVMTCFHLFIVLYEEPHLRHVFREQYEDYCRNVSRWIPHFKGYHPTAT